ncbi:hypothetical protein DEI91_11720 [Curtobacterium sp. MCBD17_032]|nr:hypothetical protein DEI91_11720 [Curtobacterium sp. MCBD17_032]
MPQRERGAVQERGRSGRGAWTTCLRRSARTPDAGRRTPDAGRRTPDAGRPTPDAGRDGARPRRRRMRRHGTGRRGQRGAVTTAARSSRCRPPRSCPSCRCAAAR